MKSSPKSLAVAVLLTLLLAGTGFSADKFTPEEMARVAGLIREEGLNSSQLMETLTYLTDVIGPRLTGSPNHKRANEWTRDKLACWGLTNAHLEAFGPFGRGWSLERFSVQLVSPQNIPLLAFPKAWSPGLDEPILADVIYLNATNTADLDRFKGKLKGCIVLTSPLREIQTRFEPLASRMSETNLLRLANAGTEARGTYGSRSGATPFRSSSSTNSVPSRSAQTSTNARPPRPFLGARLMSFLQEEGAALLVSVSPMGESGVVFVGSASIPSSQRTNETRAASEAYRPWATNAPPTPPQITVAAEDYNRLARMIQLGEKAKLSVDFRVKFHDADPMVYNTIAEIPGTDLKDQIVMLGGHLDSWHAGTGATDDAVGVAAAMEAVRILKSLNLQPRRTIRVALWAGEEQGLLGSKAYVAQHFGYYTNVEVSSPLRSPKDDAAVRANRKDDSTARQLYRQPEYEKLSAYFNLDNGGGRIRGVHLQANEAVGPYFRRWLAPFKDLDADTISLSNTRGTDHISFDAIGLPGFQFIQDPLDYNTRTHHSNQDVLERIIPEDAKQAAVIMASFAYNAAMLEERLPRKPVD